jgi:hypothetical protein
MASLIRIVSVPALIILAITASPGQAEVACNPVVEPTSSDTTLKRTLSRLATEYQFTLSLPEAMDRPIQFDKSMTLERLVKRLTTNTSTVLRHRKVDGCATPALTHLIVLPVGKQGDYRVDQQPEQAPIEGYLYIDDMESFVADVMEGRESVDLDRLTPEQREEFRIVQEAVTARQAEEATQTKPAQDAVGSDAITQYTSAAPDN